MSKTKAFFIHFGVSLMVVSTLLAVMLLLWYPQPYFKAFEALDIIKVLIGVDLVLGPALTLVVYKPAKKSLWFDMSCIAALQVAALIYGTAVIYQQRPYFVVFAADRFEILARSEVDEAEIDSPALRDKPWGRPILAVAKMPEDPQARRQLIEETLFGGKPDIERRPALWRPYASEQRQVLNRARPLQELETSQPATGATVRAMTERYGTALKYVPVIGKTRAYALVLEPDTLRPVDIIDADPFGGSG